VIRIFRVSVSTGVILLWLSETFALLVAFVLACRVYLGVDPVPYLLYDNGAIRVLLAAGSMVWALYLLDLYSDLGVKSPAELIMKLVTATGVTFLVEGLISYGNGNWRLPPQVLGIGCALGVVVLLAWRMIYAHFVFSAVARRKLVFLGANSLVREIAAHLADHPELGAVVVGYLAEEPGASPLGSAKYLGPPECIREVVEAVHPDAVVVGMDERRGCTPAEELIAVSRAGYVVEEAASIYEEYCNRLSVMSLRPSQLIFSGELGPRPGNLVIHRLLDLVIASIAIVVALPLIAVIVIGIRLTSRGPILFRQKRIGLHSKPFNVLKFRSMDDNPANPSEPITTRFGDFLRKSRLNELPQLFNVLLGDMSVVGPRPERPDFVAEFVRQIPFYHHRHCIRPGITGWAQVCYEHADSVADSIKKLEYDLYYIKHVSLTLDLMVLFQTLKTLMLRRGAG
jgi:exopolysaccharide biosynthesis polyprenyl glycosylphosphotransferase